MSTNMNNSTKKRRKGEGGSGGEQSSNGGGSVHEELKTLSSHMTNMMQMMSSMKGEITRLTNESNQMKQTINAMQTAQTTMSEKMHSRFDDVVNKQQYHEVLLRNQQWKYSAPTPSEEYWDGLNVDEEADAEAEAEEFLEQIKHCTEEMRYGTGDGNIFISADLPYNEEFLPHWNEFANALEQYQYRLKCLPKDTDSTLRLCDMELTNEVVEVLSNALESTHFTKLLLSGNSLGQDGIDFVLKYLKRNCILKELCLFVNTIDNIEQIRLLCQVVKEHPSIEELDIRGCRGEGVNGYEMLQMIMSAGKNNLKVINLTNSNICTGGDTFISDFLAGNPMLECLYLGNNQLDDNDAVAIAGALKHSKKLRALDVMNNNLTRVGWKALRKVEFDDTSLNSAADSNHTCRMDYQPFEGLDTREMNGNPYRSVAFRPMYVRQKKIYSVLSTRNRECSNVGHFDEIPVEFLPDMLITIQQYSEYHTENSEMSQDTNDVNPLSLVFEVCRYWDKSLAVYELLSS